MNLPRQQHEVPRFYLAKFACPHRKMVEALDKQSGKTFIQLPENMATERDLYVFRHNDGTPNYGADDLLGHCENEVNRRGDGESAFDLVLAGQNLESGKRRAFSDFIASMFVRSPSARKQIAEARGAQIGKMASDIARDDAKWAEYVASLDEPPDDKTEAVAREEFAQQNFALQIERSATLRSISNLPKISDYVHEMVWTTLRGPRGAFVTSDSPVLLIANNRSKEEFTPFQEKHSILFFPLSSSACWVGHWRARCPSVQRASIGQRLDLNTAQAAAGIRRMFAEPGAHNLAGLVRRSVGPKSNLIGESNLPAVRPKVEIVRRIKN